MVLSTSLDRSSSSSTSISSSGTSSSCKIQNHWWETLTDFCGKKSKWIIHKPQNGSQVLNYVDQYEVKSIRQTSPDLRVHVANKGWSTISFISHMCKNCTFRVATACRKGQLVPHLPLKGTYWCLKYQCIPLKGHSTRKKGFIHLHVNPTLFDFFLTEYKRYFEECW